MEILLLRQIENELNDGFKQSNTLNDTISNIVYIRSHIQKFGITSEFLHLVDSDKQLSNSLKLELTTDTDIVLVEEAFSDITKAVKEKWSKFIIWLKEKWNNLLEFISSLFNHLGKKVKNTIQEFKDKKEEIKQALEMSIEERMKKVSYEKYKSVIFPFKIVESILNKTADLFDMIVDLYPKEKDMLGQIDITESEFDKLEVAVSGLFGEKMLSMNQQGLKLETNHSLEAHFKRLLTDPKVYKTYKDAGYTYDNMLEILNKINYENKAISDGFDDQTKLYQKVLQKANDILNNASKNKEHLTKEETDKINYTVAVINQNARAVLGLIQLVRPVYFKTASMFLGYCHLLGVKSEVSEESFYIEDLMTSIKNTENEMLKFDEEKSIVETNIDNLLFLKTHIKKFGVTKELKSLITINSFFKTKFSMNEDTDLPDTEIVLESISEFLSNAYDRLLALLKWIGEKLNNLFGFYKLQSIYYESKFEKIEESLKKAHLVFDKKKLENIPLKGVLYSDWKTIITSFKEEWKKLMTVDPKYLIRLNEEITALLRDKQEAGHLTKEDGEKLMEKFTFFQDPDKLNLILLQFDHELTYKESKYFKNRYIVQKLDPDTIKQYNSEGKKITLETSNAYELGYDLNHIIEGCSLARESLKYMREEYSVKRAFIFMKRINDYIFKNKEAIQKDKNIADTMFNGWQKEVLDQFNATLTAYQSSVTIINKGILALNIKFFHNIKSIITRIEEIKSVIDPELLLTNQEVTA